MPAVPLRRLILSAAVVAAAVACVDARAAAPSPEQQLASRYSPVVALKKQRRLCGKGEAYRPVLVDVVLGRNDVSLFNGAKGYRRLRRAPTAADLSAGPLHHYVDLPGHPVTGRCSYQHWFKRIGAKAPNAVYAHVAKEPGHTGRLALQYWLYYVFNDYNDKHESDWEQIQLHFDADTVEEALQRPPVEVLYSQHEGAERAGWTDKKLEKVGGTHVVTYPGAGSHANYYRNALWLGRGADEGLGCDDSTGPSTRVTPRAVVVPTRGAATTGRSPGPHSRVTGASVSEGSTTGRSGRTRSSNGSSRSRGQRAWSETGASPSPAPRTEGSTRATSSARGSPARAT